MSKVNIEGITPNNDPFYRYKMTRLNIVKQRTTTAINNIEDVAKDLDRDPLTIVEYFKCSLGFNPVYKKGVLTTTKDLTQAEIDNSLKEFIEFFVLCKVCRLPETYYELTNKDITSICKSCSHHQKLDSKTLSGNALKSLNNIVKILNKNKKA